MPTTLWSFPVNFSKDNAGHIGSVKYLIVDANGVQRSPGGSFAFSASGVAESAYCPGKYEVSMTIDTAWAYPLDITWQDTIAGAYVPDKLYLGEVNAALGLVAIAAGANGGLATAPINVSVITGSAPSFSSASTSGGVGVDASDPQYNIECPRNVQKSFTVPLSAQITGRTLTWLVKVNRTDSAILLSHDTASIGGITLNAAPVTIGGVLYAINQVATLTIGANDLSNSTTFPENTDLWQGFHLTAPAEIAAWGFLQVQTEP